MLLFLFAGLPLLSWDGSQGALPCLSRDVAPPGSRCSSPPGCCSSKHALICGPPSTWTGPSSTRGNKPCKINQWQLGVREPFLSRSIARFGARHSAMSSWRWCRAPVSYVEVDVMRSTQAATTRAATNRPAPHSPDRPHGNLDFGTGDSLPPPRSASRLHSLPVSCCLQIDKRQTEKPKLRIAVAAAATPATTLMRR
jgi:hypothetical protein